MNVIELLKKEGHNTVDSSFYTHIDKWKQWYKGKADFHNYKIYNGLKIVDCTRKSLGMAKKISEDKADLLLNEKVSINLSSEKAQSILDIILDENNFWVRGNQLIELSQALGTGAIVESLENDDIKMDFIQADCIFPLMWDNGQITECAFASKFVNKKGKFTYINIHSRESNNYVIYNKLYDDYGGEVELPEGLIPEWKTNSPIPLFQIITPNIVNNINTNIPMGISIYANSIDSLEGIDLIYDSYQNEFKLGKKRIFVDDSIVKVDIEKGGTKPVFDSNDTTFYGIPLGGDSKNKPIEESNMTLRAQEHELALQTNLNILSSKCGFGQNYYQFDKSGLKTATEVVSENSQLYRNIKKDEIILEKALTDMVRAFLFLANLNIDEEINIAFDDSIIEDTEAIAKRAMLELQNGVIDNVIYYQRVYGYTEDQAKKIAQEIAGRSPSPQETDFIPGGDGDE